MYLCRLVRYACACATDELEYIVEPELKPQRKLVFYVDADVCTHARPFFGSWEYYYQWALIIKYNKQHSMNWLDCLFTQHFKIFCWCVLMRLSVFVIYVASWKHHSHKLCGGQYHILNTSLIETFSQDNQSLSFSLGFGSFVYHIFFRFVMC